MTCNEPPTISGGTRTGDTGTYEYGHEVEYTCNPGTKFIDGRTERTMQCLVASSNGEQVNGLGAWNNEVIQQTEDADVSCNSTSLSC